MAPGRALEKLFETAPGQYEVTIFNENVIKWVKENTQPGDLVHVRGTLRQTQWENSSGGTEYGMTLAADDFDNAFPFLVKAGSQATTAMALADAIRLVLNDAARREQLIESGLKRAEEFSMARLADVYLARYERLISHAAV